MVLAAATPSHERAGLTGCTHTTGWVTRVFMLLNFMISECHITPCRSMQRNVRQQEEGNTSALKQIPISLLEQSAFRRQITSDKQATEKSASHLSLSETYPLGNIEASAINGFYLHSSSKPENLSLDLSELYELISLLRSCVGASTSRSIIMRVAQCGATPS